MPGTVAPPEDRRFERLRELGGDYYASLIGSGYREWYSGSGLGTPYLLQKCIRLPDGTKKMFLNVWVWDFSAYADRGAPPISYAPEAQFNTRGGVPTFDVKLFHRDGMTPADIEAFFAKVYEAMGCGPYGE